MMIKKMIENFKYGFLLDIIYRLILRSYKKELNKAKDEEERKKIRSDLGFFIMCYLRTRSVKLELEYQNLYCSSI